MELLDIPNEYSPRYFIIQMIRARVDNHDWKIALNMKLPLNPRREDAAMIKSKFAKFDRALSVS